jgi:glycosyltransferase involved in cell wall biosynthesis
MRVLVVSNTPFAPADAGNRVRIAEMLRYLAAQGAELGVLLLADWDTDRWDLAGMRSDAAWVEVARPSLLARARRRFAPRAAPGADLDVDAWCPSWFRERVRAAAEAWRPDVVLAEYVFLSACLEGLPASCLRVIDTHDVMHRRRAAYDAAGVAPSWFLTTRAEERRGLVRADLVLAMHDADAACLRELAPGCEILTVGHGCHGGGPSDIEPVAGRVLFAGSFNDLNVAGLRWFLAEVWPRVRAQAEAELHVCGTVAEKLGEPPPGVVVRGTVPALAPEIGAACVVVDPLRAGTGLQIKLADALAHGRPVVATPAAAAGFPAGEEHGVVVAGDATAFADAVVALLVDWDRWRRVAAGAADAAQRFEPEAAFGPLWRRLARGAGSGSGPAPV